MQYIGSVLRKATFSLWTASLLGCVLTGCDNNGAPPPDQGEADSVVSAGSQVVENSVNVRPIQDEVIYFVMPDRFADGDPGNNTGGIAGGADDHGYDPKHKGYFHGGDFQGLIDKLDYIQGLGATAIWLTPIFKNKPVQGPPPYRSAGYHGYWITDFTQVDPHLGTNEDFRQLVDAAHQRGMKVIMDIVTNHTADVIQYRECVDGEDETGPFATDCPYRSLSAYPYTTRGGADGPMINPGFAGDGPADQTLDNFAKLSDPTYAYTPFIPAGEAQVKVPDWLNQLRYYHNRGNTHWEGESALYGDFAGLDDVLTEHPRVVDGMIEIYQQWITDFKVDGFRIDTAKHVNDSFWQRFIPAIQQHARDQGIDNFYLFGEVYSFDPEFLGRYTREVGFPAVLDFAFQGVAREVVAQNQAPIRLQNLFAKDNLYQRDPNDPGHSGALILPTFLGNHDMGRLGHFLLEGLGEKTDDEVLLRHAELAYALLFFSRGIPVIYYGDEQGFSGHGGDQDARQDMFPSQVASYIDNRQIGTDATPAADNFDPQHPLYRAIAGLATVFHEHPGLRRGEQNVLLAEHRPGVFAFTRQLDAPQTQTSAAPVYLAVLNTSRYPRRARIPIPDLPRHWQPLTGNAAQPVEIRHDTLYLDLPPVSYVLYRSDTGDGAPRPSP